MPHSPPVFPDAATFRRLIRNRLPALSIPPARQAAVEAELAQLLADAWEREDRPAETTAAELEAWCDIAGHYQAGMHVPATVS